MGDYPLRITARLVFSIPMFLIAGFYALIGVLSFYQELYVDYVFTAFVGWSSVTIQIMLEDPYLWWSLVISLVSIYLMTKILKFARGGSA